MSAEAWEPKIVAFCCNWCSYGGADSAGMGRFQQPPSTRIIRVMCSGRIDPLHVFNAFLEGADAVLVTGCHIGDCHYVNGNDKTKIKYKFLESVVRELGIEKERLQLNWISASEGEKFASFIRDVTEQIKKLGPSPLKPEGVS
ncbi:coenzyme F420-reducing hydrogenase, delta subunit [Candidatus Methanoperedens nitroreducens]|uniref:Coenzyme F420-reducing hydrogenase, delta subunit n=1 Tax=Candidatus Methanoperedens nitratireducens TaxID=1392998 RepID=A0A062UWS5_9EURY|nr:hydrogenase iron-sulfur subunit [Candidatus Methanoperedens nitroreducens]KCZ71431.1 coenzyme F420-reducing hydrogenase, delta subunit [Candidatus Methanoperedens nitroreducens]MDJ1421057.1 hydrogenase iron-sulfur subunit [Candidatus Methanoperedens sp.]